MARIRRIQIEHFRSIQKLDWLPAPGINCLVGPGDSGKSTVIDAIDLCLGARRNIQFTDADFCHLDIDTPISISVTIGDLDDALKNLESYGLYLRGFDAESNTVEDEPEKDAETVITVRLTVSSDLEPDWSLVSERASALDAKRDLSWGDRGRVAPTRIGVMADYHLSWGRGSVLNRVSAERADTSAALAKAARSARDAFGDDAQDQLGEALRTVVDTAKALGIPVGENIKAMLDVHSVSFSGGTVSLHDGSGVPLRGLGTGSTRLLISGLQRKAATQSAVILIDELEYGLEPHRIIRLLGSLGAKEKEPPLQVFMTTHSPVVVRELCGNQLFIIRSGVDEHTLRVAGTDDSIQGTIRLYPDAFLATSVIACEGASEVGFVRGLDQYRTAYGGDSISAQGATLVDCCGVDNVFTRAAAFRALGYRVVAIRDDDKKPTPEIEATFVKDDGKVIAWRDRRALEDELFLSLTHQGVGKLVERAVQLCGEDLINDHIKSATQNGMDLPAIRAEIAAGLVTLESRGALGKAARGKGAWFKTVTKMEDVARDIVGPDLPEADAGFRQLIEAIFAWVNDAQH